MAKDWQIRLTDTLTYVRGIRGIPKEQFTKLQQYAENKEQVSNLIRLGGARLLPNAQETRRRQALRGLLLCLVWCDEERLIAEAKRHYEHAPENEIADAIASFFPVEGADASDVVKVAVKEPEKGLKYDGSRIYQYRRGLDATRGIATNSACYESVAFWLYLGGVVSLRWLLKHGDQPNTALPDQWTWEQRIIGIPEHATQIPANRFVRFHRPNGVHGSVLHYTLSVATGQCRGNHNSEDVILYWQKNCTTPPLRRYGPPLWPVHKPFSIAGYLACMIELNPATGPQGPAWLGLRVAPVTPRDPF